MNRRLYWTLAWTGIRKNRQIYLPYILTCVCVVMIYYILASLVWSQVLLGTYGGRTMTTVLSLGRVVIAVFSVIFLFYTHSFLIRRRRREFGMYNVLGMNKRDIRRILLRESLIVYAVMLVCGLSLGILFSKLSELLLLRIGHLEVSYTLTVSTEAIGEAAALYAAIFVLILLVSIARVQISSPMALLRSENLGEKPPKANYVMAILGVFVLAAAYYLALTIEDPVQAMMVFFIAVLLVIAATYMLFVSGSVALCRTLQKNKAYYYRPNHFVSVSSMVYRMKRNGAGLASICILSTMVLVMLATTVTLFAGTEDNLRKAYPSDFFGYIYVFDKEDLREDYLEKIRAAIPDALDGETQDPIAYRMVSAMGFASPDGRDPDGSFYSWTDLENRSQLRETATLELIYLSDFNAVTGKSLTLGEGEAMMWASYDGVPVPESALPEVFTFRGENPLRVVSGFDYPALRRPYEAIGETLGETLALVLPDPLAYLGQCRTEDMDFTYNYMVSTDLTREGLERFSDPGARLTFVGTLRQQIPQTVELGYSGASRAEARLDAYALYGSLFFLGVMLSIVFLLAAVLIIYYKQVSEGYEDAGRFDVMRKVGMTRREIRRSINSQVLTVFFAPLLMAGLHIAFAFPMIRRMLLVFSVTDLSLLIPVYVGAFVLFALFYAVVYRRTAVTYLSIVSPVEKAA